ncbi:gamma-2-syntrophin isoform X10 [Rhinolophus ferrumequinum]|uniref:gamma-2-syntrophin isoform X10 n=1 Tax=Rhinolophus ferrumequinum TaxID=59479 RepID=UPI00140F8488|nr:gamma-2-syntrophin isoform X10 [Rhinolophus ferrumequinum]
MRTSNKGFQDIDTGLWTSVRGEEFQTKTGVVLLHDEASGNAYAVRLKLTKEVLTIQTQDVICVSASNRSANHRTVTLRRQPVGGLGLSIKGGAEYRVPAVISKVFKGHAADRTGMLFTGDAVLQVNGINVGNSTHEEVVHLLRNAGDEVTITVEHLREAPSFLKLPLGSPGPPSAHSSRASSPLFDSGLHLNGSSSHTAPSSPPSPVANEPKYEKRWLDAWSVPLSMARISRYRAGAETLRPDAFQVVALDGVSSGLLQFPSTQEHAGWLRAVSANISDLTLQTVSILDWVRAEKTYNLCEVLFKVDKPQLPDACSRANLGFQDPDFGDQGPHCFSVQVGRGGSHSFSVELGSELAEWEVHFQRATFMEVQRTGSRTYVCSWRGRTLCLTVDFALGFTCFDSRTKNVLWRYKFSQLKGSSDDGKGRVRLLFQNLDTKQIETKELEFQDLTAVLHCVHSFMAAKVASVDAAFMDSQSVTRKFMHSS